MPDWIHTLTVDASYHADAGVTGVGIVIQERVNNASEPAPIQAAAISKATDAWRPTTLRAKPVSAARSPANAICGATRRHRTGFWAASGGPHSLSAALGMTRTASRALCVATTAVVAKATIADRPSRDVRQTAS